MKFSQKNLILSFVFAVVLSTSAFAKLPVRRASQNGEDINAIHWNLLSVSQPQVLSGAGKKASITRQIVCLNQDVENTQFAPDITLSGTCHSGFYVHIFQIKSTSLQPVTVTIGQLVNFQPDDGSVSGTPNYGVLTCDSDANTLELCINDTNPDDVPDITFTEAKNKTNVSFVIPSFPDFPAGTGNQGQGMTIFVVVEQAPGIPVLIPKIGIR